MCHFLRVEVTEEAIKMKNFEHVYTGASIMSESTIYTIPNLIECCQAGMTVGLVNPHYKTASVESKAWVNSFGLFTPRQRLIFDKTDGGLLAAYAWPTADYEKFRTACDFMNLLWVVDEISDDQSGAEVIHTGEIWVKSMRDPNWHHDSELCRASREYVYHDISCRRLLRSLFSFRERFMKFATPRHLQRFLERCKQLMLGAAEEAKLRQRGEVLSLDAYIPLRRVNVGVYVCFAFTEAVLGVDLPEEVYNDPVFNRLYDTATDLVWWANVSPPSPIKASY